MLSTQGQARIKELFEDWRKERLALREADTSDFGDSTTSENDIEDEFLEMVEETTTNAIAIEKKLRLICKEVNERNYDEREEEMPETD